MNALQSNVVLITGAVGNLGFATAQAVRAAGGRTVLIDRSNDRLKATFPDLVDSPDHFLAGGVNLSDEASVKDVVEKVLHKFGTIDALVNTVGAWRGGKPAHETPLSDWSALYELNVMTTLYTCRAVVPHFLTRRRGRIVNIAARAGFVGDAGSAAYSAAKSAVLRLTESLSAELKTSGINVNCVLPSTIDTPQNRAAMPLADHSKWVEPSAIADTIAFLLSDGARAIHGVALPVYGLG